MPALNFWKFQKGINLAPNSAPSSPTNGDVYYDSGTNTFKFYQNGSFATFATTTGALLADGTVPLTAAWNTGNFQIKHGDGTVSLPTITFNSDNDTGLYRVGSNNVGASANGALVWQWDTTGITLNSSSVIFNTDGSVTNPSYTFNSDTNTGMYRELADKLAWATGGVRGMALSTSFLFADVPIRLLSTGGSVSVPALQWDGDPDTGFYNPSANVLGVVTGGAEIARFDTTSLKIGTTAALVGGESLTVIQTATTDTAIRAAYVQGLNTFNGAMSNIQAGSLGETKRTITSSQTDTGTYRGSFFRNVFDIASGQTLTNSAGWAAAVVVGATSLVSGGSLAISAYRRIYVASDTTATGTRKTGIFLEGVSGATNNAQISDNESYTGDYFINSTNTNPSFFNGTMAIQNGNIGLTLGADSNATTKTDATTKTSRNGMVHYTNAEEPLALIGATSSSVANIVRVGGGFSSENAATDVNIYTASDTTTVTGTVRLAVSGQNVTVGGASETAQHVLNTSLATNGSGVLTLTNGPSGTSGNPVGYIQITINGTTRYIPFW